MKYSGMNMGQVKKQNRSVILQYINEVGPVSRKDIADATGLTPAAVTQISTNLLSEKILVELGTDQDSESGRAGRKKVLIGINQNYANVATICIENEATVLTIANLEGKALAQKKLSTNHQQSAVDFLHDIGDELESLIQSIEERHRRKIKGVSVTVPGLVEREQGISKHAYGLWNEPVPIADILGERLSYPIIVENNVNAFAMAELLYGVGRQYDNFLLVKWGPGVGSAIVTEKRIYEGRHGKAAELGHFIVKKDGRACACGRRGCLETEVSYQRLNELQPFALEQFEASYTEIYAPALDLLARTIVNSITILEPNRVVLCGKLLAGETIRKRLIDACQSYDARYDENRILYSGLAQREDFLGAVANYFHTNIISQN